MVRWLYFLATTTFYLALLLLLITFKNIDTQFNISYSSFINILSIMTCFYLFFIVLGLYAINKEGRIKRKQLKALKESDSIIDEYQKDELVVSLYEKLFLAKQAGIRLNEEQEKWVHDIKLPLATLKLFIDNNKQRLESKDTRLLEIIALELESSINKKIMFDKIELEIDDFKIEKFNFNQLLNEVIRKFRPSFMMKELSLDIILEEINIVSDQKSIRYILEQIISNAIKYSYNQGVVRIYEEEGYLVIENTGEAISSQDISRLFDKGFTGVNSSNKGMASTGLGLYMVKKSMDYLNHEIKIKSKENVTKVLLKF
ncbi:MAG: HAMP domain-containing sensor histidine kinase [Erysipelotrichales bacterium]